MVTTDNRPSAPVAEELLSRACQGEAEAFCLLLSPLQDRLLRQAIALCASQQTAEDLVSETLVEAWKSLQRYNRRCRLSTWLYAILLHRHQKWLRRARCRPISLAWLPFRDARKFEKGQEQIVSADASPAEAAAQRDAFRRLVRCVQRLPAKHRQVILLRFFEDASLPDIATLCGCSVGTIKSRLHHALEKLRKMNVKEETGDQ